jgi:aspartyl-tRNA(Asn)/glutamyl-tRNA(Gln) amidotransferase subunit A
MPLLPTLDCIGTFANQANASTLRNTVLLSYLGACGITAPAPVSRPGPRTGILLSRPHGHDDPLLADAAWTESVSDHFRTTVR